MSYLTAENNVLVDNFSQSHAAKADLSVILSYTIKNRPDLSDRMLELETQYRQFMYLCSLGTFGSMSVPSKDVDEIWHSHVLHTSMYRDFCSALCGRFIDHNPYDEKVSREEKLASKLSLQTASMQIFGTGVFGNGVIDGDCGYCGGCSNCSGDCGAAACGGAGCDNFSPVIKNLQNSACQADCVCNKPESRLVLECAAK